MAERQYLPANWVDEVNPPPHADPAAFARRNPDGSWVLLPTDDDYDPEDLDVYRTPIEPGQEVAFLTVEDSGDATLIVQDGSWRTAPELPSGTEWVWLVGEPETCTTSARDLVSDCSLDAGEYPIRWCRTGEARLRFAPDGETPRFVAVEDQSHG